MHITQIFVTYVCGTYRIAQKFDSGNFDDIFDEWLVIRQSLPYKPLSLNVSPMKPTINSSKFYSSNFCE